MLVLGLRVWGLGSVGLRWGGWVSGWVGGGGGGVGLAWNLGMQRSLGSGYWALVCFGACTCRTPGLPCQSVRVSVPAAALRKSIDAGERAFRSQEAQHEASG